MGRWGIGVTCGDGEKEGEYVRNGFHGWMVETQNLASSHYGKRQRRKILRLYQDSPYLHSNYL